MRIDAAECQEEHRENKHRLDNADGIVDNGMYRGRDWQLDIYEITENACQHCYYKSPVLEESDDIHFNLCFSDAKLTN